MVDVPLRLVTRFQRHPVHGLNAIAQWLPRTGWNGEPDDPAPPIVAIICDSESPQMAETLDPPQLPAFALWANGTSKTTSQGRPATQLDIAGAYCTNARADPLAAIVECSYILRAARLCMTRFNSLSFSEAEGEPSYRMQNGIRIMEMSSCEEARRTATSKGKKTKMWGFLDITLIVVDGITRLPPVLTPFTP
jgi:hypothetical protein